MQTRLRLAFLAIIVAVGLFAPSVLGAQAPSVTSVTEGKDPTTGNPVLLIYGKGLNRIVDITLVDPSGPTLLESPSVITRKSGYLHIALPGGMEPGTYDLTLADTHQFREILVGTCSPSLPGQEISEARQTIRFSLDEGGADLESHAVLATLGESPSVIVDRPFLLALMEKGKKDPYLLLWIGNDELLAESPK